MPGMHEVKFLNSGIRCLYIKDTESSKFDQTQKASSIK